MQIELSAVHARHPALRPEAPDTLRGLDLRIGAGEAVALIGPSGAGKTSLLQLMGAALPPRQGRLLLDGQDPWRSGSAGLRALRRQLLLAPQTPPLPPRQRVVTAVLAARLPQWSLARSLMSLVRPQEPERARAALEALGLGDKLWERVDRLSGGERQRVGLARALVGEARLWLVDEPLSALDPTRAAEALELLLRTARARGVTLVASLHHVELALRSFPRVIGLREGELMFDRPAAEVSPALLSALYAQHESELQQPLASPEPPVVAPVPLTCR
ncbi:phosphonate ABC transporter ATP-binding protein [Inhella sp.]|uniref:phosphonate ABC transporter ATP-binding protein n=1 Tax=Inhella sp. TaxID=1921806 RepID=UPI0035B3178D